MADLHRPVEQALTLAEHRALEAKRGRPVTDWPVGTLTARKRALDAELSALVTPNNGYTPPRRTAEKENH